MVKEIHFDTHAYPSGDDLNRTGWSEYQSQMGEYNSVCVIPEPTRDGSTSAIWVDDYGAQIFVAIAGTKVHIINSLFRY